MIHPVEMFNANHHKKNLKNAQKRRRCQNEDAWSYFMSSYSFVRAQNAAQEFSTSAKVVTNSSCLLGRHFQVKN